MNCSNCNEVDLNFNLPDPVEVMCENGHALCTNCFTKSPQHCIQCGALIVDFKTNLNLATSEVANDMIFDWLKFNEHHGRFPNPIDEDINNYGDGTSLNLIYTRKKNEDKESVTNEILISNSDSKTMNVISVKNSEHSTGSNLAKKDTRQNLLEQMREELRRKIKEGLYSSYKTDPRSLIRPEEFMRETLSQSVGVSTNSQPNLTPNEDTDKDSDEQLVNVVDLNQNQPADIASSIKKDQSVLTQESQLLSILREKFSKMNPTKLEKIIISLCNAEDTETNSNENKPKTNEDQAENTNSQPEVQHKEFILVSNCSRASYCPPNAQQPMSTPKPQFQPIAPKTKYIPQIVDAGNLNISRNPVVCPISSCQQANFVSNFARHIAVDHSQVPLERMFPRQCKNFFLDPKLIHNGSNRCQLLLLVNDKIKNLGHDKFKDFIPVLVMSTKVNALELCTNKKEIVASKSDTNYLMIWLTGIIAQQEPIFFSLTVWARTGNVPSCHVVHSGKLYSVRNSQNSQQIHESGQMLLLSQNQVDLLTNKGRNMLELQIQIN